jgi:HEAT repeat protein
MCGRGASAGTLGDVLVDSQLQELQVNLRSGDEATRLHAAYRLARSAANTNGVVEILVDALREQVALAAPGIVWDDEDWIEAARPPANLHGTNPTALSAAQGLAAAGNAGTAALVALLKEKDCESHWLLRVHVLDALSLSGQASQPALNVALESAILALLADENYWVRRSASEAVGRGVIASSAAVVNGLVQHLQDAHRHVRRQAAISLGQLGPSAM